MFSTYASQGQVPFFLSMNEFLIFSQLPICLTATALNKIDALVVGVHSISTWMYSSFITDLEVVNTITYELLERL